MSHEKRHHVALERVGNRVSVRTGNLEGLRNSISIEDGVQLGGIESQTSRPSNGVILLLESQCG